MTISKIVVDDKGISTKVKVCYIDNNKIIRFYLDDDGIREAIYIEADDAMDKIYLRLRSIISSDIILNYKGKNFKFNIDNVYINHKMIIFHTKGVTIVNE